MRARKGDSPAPAPLATLLPEKQVADYRQAKTRWSRCQECGEEIWTDHCGRQFYHRISCSLTNGIRYKKDRG